MVKKKVTLSLDSKTYEDFQEYCDKNALMLSKKIELVMKELLQGKKRFLFIFGFVFFMAIMSSYALMFEDSNMGDFNAGTYANTSYNGTGIVLSGNNLSGSFTSRIFDAGAAASVDSFNFTRTNVNTSYLFLVDATSGIFISRDGGFNWTEGNASYGAGGGSTNDLFADNRSLYAVFSSTNKQIHKSTNFGTSWSIVNDSFTGPRLEIGDSDYVGNLYVLRGAGQVYRSSDAGVTWSSVGDINGGASSSPKGIAVNSTNGIFSVDASGGVFSSIDSGVTWIERNASYGGGAGTDDMTIDGQNNLYILLNKQVYKSTNFGTSWNIVNDSFTPYANDGVKMTFFSSSLFIADANGRVFRSNNTGVSWSEIGDANGGSSSNPKGFTAHKVLSHLSVQVRNCSVSCTNEPFLGPDGTSNTYFSDGTNMANFTGRYFQYKTYFSSRDNYTSSILNNVSMGYRLLDTTVPSLTVYSPQNMTYASNSVLLNYSVSDSSGIGSCMYLIDGVAFSLPNCTTAVVSGLSEGSHTINISVNDTLGNVNSSHVTFSVDTQPPLWSNLGSNIPASYSPSQLSFFNVTWSNNTGLGSVWFESNFSGQSVNYSMYLISGDQYGFNASLPAGGFYWRSYANDSVGNLNFTSTQSISVARSGNPISLLLNGNASNLSLSYGTSVNASASASAGSVTITRDSILVSNPEIVLLGARVQGYEYFANASGNENYTSNSTILYVFVAKQSPLLMLTLNGQAQDLEVYYGNLTSAQGSESNVGDGDMQYSLYRSEGFVGFGSSVSDEHILGVGNYTYIYNTTGGENYTEGSVTRTLTVLRQTPHISFLLNGVASNSSQVYGDLTNASASLDPASLVLALFRDGSLIANSSGVIGENIQLAAGNYNYTASFAGDENYTNVSVHLFLEVVRASPNISLLLNGVASDTSLPVGSALSIHAQIFSPVGEEIDLSEEGLVVATGSDILLDRNYTSPGVRTWAALFDETQNYSEGNLSFSVSMLDSSAPQYSNLQTSPSSPAIYSPSAQYNFSISWTDNVGIEDVIITFNGLNRTYSGSEISRNGDNYTFSTSNLGAGNYSYRWYANDSSGTLTSTPVQSYTVSRSPVTTFLSFTPSNVVDYGVIPTIQCSSSASQPTLALTRNGFDVSNPNNPTLAAGTYVYVCASKENQNYTSSSSTSFLSINRISPTFNLTLNGIESDLNLPAGGGAVSILASSILPLGFAFNVSIDSLLVNQSITFFNLTRTFDQVGEHTIQIISGSNQNYSIGSFSRTVNVPSPVPPAPSGGGGGGGSGGGTPNVNGFASVSIDVPSPFYIKRGQQDAFTISVENNGQRFLNGCTLSFDELFARYFSVAGESSLSSGESYDFHLTLTLDGEVVPGQYRADGIVSCGDYESSFSQVIVVTPTEFDFRFSNYTRDADVLHVTYLLKNLIGRNQHISLDYVLLNLDGNILAEGSFERTLESDVEERSILDITLPKDAFGEFNLIISADNGRESLRIDRPIFLSSAGLTGLVISDENRRALTWFAVALFAVIVFILVMRYIYKRYQLAHYHPPRHMHNQHQHSHRTHHHRNHGGHGHAS